MENGKREELETGGQPSSDADAPAGGKAIHPDGSGKKRVAITRRKITVPRGRDRIIWIPVGLGAALFVAIVGYVWSSLKAYLIGRDIRRAEIYWRDHPPEPEGILPLKELLHAEIEAGPEGDKGAVTLKYTFPHVADVGSGKPADVVPQLRDWDCKVEKDTLLPVAPALSNVSFEGDIDVYFGIRLWRRTDIMVKACWFEGEKTGIIFAYMRDGRCFLRLLRRGYDYEIGEERRLAPTEKGKEMEIRLAVRERDVRAFVDGQLVCEGRVPAEWPKDRRYEHGETHKMLAADLKRPPIAGFVGLETGDKLGARIDKISVRGRVSRDWVEEKSRCVRALRAIESFSGAKESAARETALEPAEEETGSAGNAPADRTPEGGDERKTSKGGRSE